MCLLGMHSTLANGNKALIRFRKLPQASNELCANVTGVTCYKPMIFIGYKDVVFVDITPIFFRVCRACKAPILSRP
jgi:hypothetical protein